MIPWAVAKDWAMKAQKKQRDEYFDRIEANYPKTFEYIGNTIEYAASHGETVAEFGHDVNRDGEITFDVGLIAEVLTERYGYTVSLERLGNYFIQSLKVSW